MDQLSPFLAHLSLSAQAFFAGETCSLAHFSAEQSLGHLHVLRQGSLQVKVRGEEIATIHEPCVLFFARPSQHSLQPLDAKNVTLLCATLDLGSNVHHPLALSLPECLILPLSRLPGLDNTLTLLFDEAFGSQCGREAALSRLLEYFIIQILRHIIASGEQQAGLFAALADPQLARVMNAMHTRPAHPWTLETLAAEAGMSRARFAGRFREVTGTTTLDYLTGWRLSLAQQLLAKGKSIKQVASAVGYQSPAALTRVFGKYLGQSPSQWQQAKRLPDSAQYNNDTL